MKTDILHIYTLVNTPDGRVGIHVGSVFGGNKPCEQHVIFEDLTEWHFIGGGCTRRQRGTLINTDSYKPTKSGDPHWQAVLLRWLAHNRLSQAVDSLTTSAARQLRPECWADIEGPAHVLCNAFTGFSCYTFAQVVEAWPIAFGHELPTDIAAIIELYHADAQLRWKEYSHQQDISDAHRTGKPIQSALPGFNTWDSFSE